MSAMSEIDYVDNVSNQWGKSITCSITTRSLCDAASSLCCWGCDEGQEFWRGYYVLACLAHSDCGKVGDEEYVTGKYSAEE